MYARDLSSRSKKKAGRGALTVGASASSESAGSSQTTGERIAAMLFGAVIFFAGGVYAGISIFESWTVALVVGAVGAVLAIVLVSRGDTLF